MSHKPVYFAYGQPSSKLQFSFRSQLSDAMPVNFAYSQIIFWDLHKDSKPFRDATYTPEFFYRMQPPGDLWQGWGAVDFGLWEHNSNGKGAVDSRSYDQTYVRAVYAKDWGRFGAIFGLKLKYVYNKDNTNDDIEKYVGPVDIDVRLVRLFDSILDRADLIATVQPGGRLGSDFARGGYQLSANFHIRGLSLNPAFYVQYYHGYAETLINYNERENSFRAGFMF